MNSLRAYLVLSLIIGTSHCASAQEFHFGATAAGIISQVDGDHLSGFNYLGYSVGILGGYSISEDSWIQVELQYANIGSSQKNETAEMSLPVDMEVISVLAGFSMKFGDAWDGTRKFRLCIGPQFNTILKASANGLSKDDLRNYISGQLMLSHFASENLLLNLSYSQSFQNILKESRTGTTKLVPYYISLGASYYLYR